MRCSSRSVPRHRTSRQATPGVGNDARRPRLSRSAPHPCNGKLMRQDRPCGSKTRSISPARSRSMQRSMSRVPKPRRVGASTAGPPRSRHSRSSVRPAPSRSRQTSESLPSSEESAPYLAALVASSFNAIVRLSAARALSVIGGPCTSSRSSGTMGPRTSCARKSSGAFSQCRLVSRSCARARPNNLFSYLSLKSSRLLECRAVCIASDCTVASVFFTRWFNSSIKVRCRFSACFRSVMSTSMLIAPISTPWLSYSGVGYGRNGTKLPSGRSAIASTPRTGRPSFRAAAIGH